MKRCPLHVATSALCTMVTLVPLSARAHSQGAREVPSAVMRDPVQEVAIASPKVTCATLRADGSWVDATLSADGFLVAPDGSAAMQGALAVLGPDGRTLLAGRQHRSAFRAVSGQSELILADGQRMPGGLAGAFTDPQGGMRVVWKHLGLGAIDVPLDRVAGFSLQGGAAIPVAQSADVVRLANGDTIEGVVERIGEVFVLDQQGQRREIPVDRIAACGFVTSPAPQLPVRVWQADGTILDGTELKPVGDLAFALAGPALLQGRSLVVLTAEEMHGAMLTGGADARVVPLAAIVPAVEAVEGAQLSTSTPQAPTALDGTAPLDLSSLEIRGPVRLVYEVPKGSERLVGELSVRDRLRQWAHAPVVVKQGARQLLSGALDAATPTLALDIRLDPALSGADAALTIEISEGQRAAIGDVFVLDRGAFIVRGSGGS